MDVYHTYSFYYKTLNMIDYEIASLTINVTGSLKLFNIFIYLFIKVNYICSIKNIYTTQAYLKGVGHIPNTF